MASCCKSWPTKRTIRLINATSNHLNPSLSSLREKDAPPTTLNIRDVSSELDRKMKKMILNHKYHFPSIQQLKKKKASQTYFIRRHIPIITPFIQQMQNQTQDPRIEVIQSKGRYYPNFPKEGVTFLDIFPIIGNPQCLQLITQLFSQRLAGVEFDRICMLESKGFILGPILAMRMNKSCFPLRKKGKLPGQCARLKYQLEYGGDEIEIQKQNVKKGERIVIIDDVFATGGTLNAAMHLIEQEGGTVAHILCLNRVVAAKGMDRIKIKPDLIYCIYDT